MGHYHDSQTSVLQWTVRSMCQTTSPAAGFSLRTRIPCPLRIPCTFFAELSTQAVDDVIMPALTAITRLSTEAIHTHTHVRCPALSAPRVFYASPQATV